MTRNDSSQHLEKAQAYREAAHESFERCDTDGFLSQWAHGLHARLEELKADIANNGGRAEFLALFDLEGNLVAAKEVKTRYGYAWGILESDDPRSRFVAWFNPSKARSAAKALENDRRKGYQVGYVMAKAKADFVGSTNVNVAPGAIRLDGGFSRDVTVTDTPAERGIQSHYYAVKDW